MIVTSNTLVKNGMPYIGKVLLAAAPYMDEMLVTISAKSSDGTIQEVEEVKRNIGDKLTIFWEDEPTPRNLTKIRNLQAKRSISDWILFLDDDDYWPEDQLSGALEAIAKDQSPPAYCVHPYQVIDENTHDFQWREKWFSKFLKHKGLQYVKEWPDDMPADKDGNILYHKTNKAVKKLPFYFYHLSYLKPYTFRDEKWASRYRKRFRRELSPFPLPQPFRI